MRMTKHKMRPEEPMPLLRVKKHAHNYFIVDKSGVEDVRLSFRARGLLLYLLTKPDDWEVDVRFLATQTPEGRDAIYTAMKELEAAGYAKKILARHGDGTFHGYTTWIYEHPDLASTDNGKPGTGFPPITENQERVFTPTPPITENQERVFTPTIKVTKDLMSKDLKEEDLKKEEGKTPPPPSSREGKAATETITTPEEFVALYNANIPQGIPMAKTLSPERRKRIEKYRKDFPAREFWITCFRAPYNSAFLRGEKPRPGHEQFKFDIDFLLRKGQDGTENCVKVYEGKYADQPPQEHSPPDTPDPMEGLSPRTQETIKQAQRSYERMMSNPRWNPAARKDDHAQS